MHFVYIDDSGDSAVYGYSALAVPVEQFRPALNNLKAYRRELRVSDGIFINKEFHAVEFCAGRGRLGKNTVTKWRRCEIFKLTLQRVTCLPDVKLFNAFGPRDAKLRVLERLVNRINRAMREWGSTAILVFDEGEQRTYTSLIRKMGVFNPIRSAYGVWQPENCEYRNIPIEYVIEDPYFRSSKESYFIQMADFCGYALLQRERPTTNPKRARFRLAEAFSILRPILVTEANRNDPDGIVRRG